MLLLKRESIHILFVQFWASPPPPPHTHTHTQGTITPMKMAYKGVGTYTHDFFEKGKFNFLIMVDAYSKLLEVIPMSSTTSLKTIEVSRSLFARYGIPEDVVSDDGPQLAAEDSPILFMKQNGVKFHPASNGAAERPVQTAKVALTKQVLDGKASTLSLEHQLANFPILNRNTPHTVTWQSPGELFLGRQFRNCFTLLKPNLYRAVEQQLKHKKHHDGRVRFREFKLNEVVLVCNWPHGVDHERWIPRRITRQVKGSGTYIVRCGDQIRFVHVDLSKSGRCELPFTSSVGGGVSSHAGDFGGPKMEVANESLVFSDPLVDAASTPNKVRAQETCKIGDYPRTLKNQYKRTLWRDLIPQGYRRHYSQHGGTLLGIDQLVDSFVKIEHLLRVVGKH